MGPGWLLDKKMLWFVGLAQELTNSEVAETALSSEVFALGSICDVVTSRKLVRFVGSAVHRDAPAIAKETRDENRIFDV
jgi:hypothetical protein